MIRLAPLAGALLAALMLTGCAAQEPSTGGGQQHAAIQTIQATASAEEIRAAKEKQETDASLTRCLTALHSYIELPGGLTSHDLYTRVSAREQVLLFAAPDSIGGFDNVDVSDGSEPGGTVAVAVKAGPEQSGATPDEVWASIRGTSPEADAAAAAIAAEGATFAVTLVDNSYATLCAANLAFGDSLEKRDEQIRGVSSWRIDIERNRVVIGSKAATLSDADRAEILSLAPAGVFEFVEAEFTES